MINLQSKTVEIKEQHLEVLKELINIGVGRGAGVLNSMLNSHISLHVPVIKVLKKEELKRYLYDFDLEQIAVVGLPFKGSLSGSTKLIFPAESAIKLVNAFTGEINGDIDMDAIRVGTLSEIGNIVVNSVMGSISNMLKIHFNYIVPYYQEGELDEVILNRSESFSTNILVAQTHFSIDSLQVVGEIAIFLELGSFKYLLETIENFMHSLE